MSGTSSTQPPIVLTHECSHCFGKGWNDEFRAVDGHYSGGESFRIECSACDGTGNAPLTPEQRKAYAEIGAALEAVDQYGNPISGDRIIFCRFPDCGCPGSRLCMAESGPNFCSQALNIEPGSMKKEQPK